MSRGFFVGESCSIGSKIGPEQKLILAWSRLLCNKNRNLMDCEMTALNAQGQLRHFSGHMLELDTWLEFLTDVVKRGDTLLEATVSEGGQVLSLPVAAFDGQPMRADLRQLEAEWKAALSNAQANPPPPQRPLPGRIDHYEALICRLEGKLSELSQIRQHLEPLEDRTGRYQLFLTCYQRLISAYECQVHLAHQLRSRLLQTSS